MEIAPRPTALDRETLTNLIEESFDAFLREPPDDGRVRYLRMTSGTTGGRPLLGIREMRNYSENESAWFQDIERPVVCFGPLQVRLIYISYFKHNPNTSGDSIVALDPTDFDESLGTLLEDLAPDAIIGWPFMILNAGARMLDATKKRVRAVRLTGELLRDQLYRLLRDRFPEADVRSQYVTAEIAFISKMSCAHARPRHYHPANGVQIEIADPDEAGIGDILISTLINDSIPVTRYKIGDAGRFVPGVCECGERETFELLGRRGYDYMKLAGVTLQREEFDRVAALLAGRFSDYRVDASEEVIGGRITGKLVLHVYSTGGGSEADALEIAHRYTAELFLTATHTLGDLVERGIFVPIQVVYSRQPFPVKHKDVKLRYIDHA